MTKKTFSSSKEKVVGVLPFAFDEGDAGVSSGIPTTIHLIPVGQWDHDLYGPILITASDIREFEQNFNMNVRKGVFITAGHEGFQELPAVGWITKVESRADGLWGDVDWNDMGKEALSDKQFKFYSPEFYRDYEDPQNHQLYRNVMTGGALTKSPYFKELEALVMSDKIAITKTKHSENTMDLATLLAKKMEELTAEEQAFIKANSASLTDAQKAEYTAIIDAPAETTETAEEKTAREAKEAGDANEAAGLNRDGSQKETHSEGVKKMVQISASELAALTAKADQGHEAFKELEKTKLAGAVSALTFSATNKTGTFLPKDASEVSKFMETLNAAQRTSFSALMAKIPKTTQELFAEKGVGAAAVEGTGLAEVEAKIAAKQKENPKLKYSDALKEVMSENEGLEQRYDEGLTPVGKAVKA